MCQRIKSIIPLLIVLSLPTSFWSRLQRGSPKQRLYVVSSIQLGLSPWLVKVSQKIWGMISWYKGEHKPHQNVRTCPFCLVLRSDGVSCSTRSGGERVQVRIRSLQTAVALCLPNPHGIVLVVLSSSQFSPSSLMCSHQQELRQNLASDADARTFPNGFDADYWDSKTA